MDKQTQTKIRAKLLNMCDKVESGVITTNEEKFLYCSLCYFQDSNGNIGAVDEFVKVLHALSMIRFD